MSEISSSTHLAKRKNNTQMRIALLAMKHAYMLDDFAPLKSQPDVSMKTVSARAEWEETDVIFLPGSQDVAADYDELVAEGLDQCILQHASEGKCVFGICGGLQLMGRRLRDPLRVKYSFDEKAMLGLLDIETVFQKEMLVRHLARTSDPWGNRLRGFETHRGMSHGDEPVLFRYEDGGALGYGHGKLWGTYLHACFKNKDFLSSFLIHAAVMS